MDIIEIKNIEKHYRLTSGFLFNRKKQVVKAVNDVSFNIKKGEIFSLLGRNGAGKSTIIKMLCTLLIPDRGSIKINGLDVVKQDRDVRKILTAVLPGERTLFWKLTIKENLEYFGCLSGLKKSFIRARIKELLDYFELSDKTKVLVEKLSTGQRQKAVLARALLPNPDIILLDEPTLGLDPVSARGLRDLIRDIKKEGKTVLLTTHYMYEADELSDRIGIIDQGKLVCLGTSAELKDSLHTSKMLRMETDQWGAELSDKIAGTFNLKVMQHIEEKQNKNIVVLKPNDDEIILEQLYSFCSAHRITLKGVQVTEPSLEDVFLEKTGKVFQEDNNAVLV